MRRFTGTPLRILEVLWSDLYLGPKLGLTLKELAQRLPSTAKVAAGRSLSIQAVRNALHLLSERSLVLVDNSVSFGRGRPSEVVQINVDKVITWPSTAAIVLRLHGHKNSMCEKGNFVQEVMRLELLDQDGNPNSPELIERQIRFAASRGYIGTVPEHDDILIAETRVWEDYDYLQFVSAQSVPTMPGTDGLSPS